MKIFSGKLKNGDVVKRRAGRFVKCNTRRCFGTYRTPESIVLIGEDNKERLFTIPERVVPFNTGPIDFVLRKVYEKAIVKQLNTKSPIGKYFERLS